MNAFVVSPRRAGSGRLTEGADPQPAPDQALVRIIAVGVDGTDRELMRGDYGEAPPGENSLIIGHESLGRVVPRSTERDRARCGV
jgi:threonine dehydrogenase-like Zn-dependent dehydrogenase